jgi:reverse gyrase
VVRVGEELARRGVLRGYWYVYTATSRLKDFERFFSVVTGGKKLWSAQRAWAQRLLMGESLALVAPTGVGKTTLLLTYALYQARNGRKIYYLVPTSNLVSQALSKLNEFIVQARLEGTRVLAYASTMPKHVKDTVLGRIGQREFDVLVTTTGFLSRRWDLLKDLRFDIVLVDDVDAILKNSKNVEKVLQLLGIPERALNLAMEAIKTRIRALIAKVSGKIRSYEAYLDRLKDVEAELSSTIASSDVGQLVIASATGRARGLKPKLFRELLGFDIGRVYDSIRNVYNAYVVANNPLTKVVELVSKLVLDHKLSGLVFVSQLYGRRTVKELVKRLEEEGVRVAAALSGTRVLDRFASGDVDVLVGVASYYGVIVRGLDLPERIYFTVFLEPPAQKLELEKALNSPIRIARLAYALGVDGSEKLLRIMSRLSPNEITALRIALETGESLGGRLSEVLQQLRRARKAVLEELEKLMSNRTVHTLEAAGALIVAEGKQLFYIAPDAATYVQASGRASRYYRGGMTRGVSIIVTSLPELLKLLERRLKAYVEESSFELLDSTRLKEEVARARRSRLGAVKSKLRVESTLIIVESPVKARTIARFFGKPVARRIGSIVAYETTFYNPVNETVYVATITSTRGHIYDLTVDDKGAYGVEISGDAIKPIYVPIKQCLSCNTQYASLNDTCPRCGSANVISKDSVVDALRKLATEVDTVYIATDPDVEGEKIAYDIYLVLKPFARSIRRIELHEITRQELFRALASPREVSKPLAYAQVVRRVEDRWIGFSLSRILWLSFGKHWLGAGRVQTPVLGWLVRRYEEWRRSRGYVLSLTTDNGLRIRILLSTREEAEELAKTVLSSGIRVLSVETSKVTLTPPPPYTTESLIYDASQKLGYTSEKVMRIAQELFECGLITYHRTDSTYVSTTGLGLARSYLESIGAQSEFKPRNWGTPGHHEAIRPTKPLDAEALRKAVATGEVKLVVPLRESHYRLYDLVFRRFIASQMKPVEAVKVSLELDVGGWRLSLEYVALEEPKGFTRFYQPANLRFGKLPSKGQVMSVTSAKIYRGSAVKLYSHGEVVLLMKQRGIGRPSTYARTIELLKQHGYVVESKYRKLLVPTKLGREVYSFLASRFTDLVSEERTRQMEYRIALVERGEVDPAHLLLELLDEISSKVKDSTLEATRQLIQARAYA